MDVKWSDLCPSRFTPEAVVFWTQRIEDSVSHTAGLDALEKRKFLAPDENRTVIPPLFRPSYNRYTDCAIPSFARQRLNLRNIKAFTAIKLQYINYFR
jgi:hypothetical protein